MMRKTLYFSLVLAVAAGCLLTHFPMAFAEEFRYDSHGRRDPFTATLMKGGEVMPMQKDIRLEGIVFDPIHGSMAIVNSRMMREGDSINGLILVKLDENKAIFNRGEGENLEIPVNKKSDLLKQYLTDKNVKPTSKPADNQASEPHELSETQ